MNDPDMLISLYFNGNGLMTQKNFEDLCGWIKEDPEHTRSFIRAAFVHRAIHDSLSGNDLQKSALGFNSSEQEESDLFWSSDLWKALGTPTY